MDDALRSKRGDRPHPGDSFSVRFSELAQASPTRPRDAALRGARCVLSAFFLLVTAPVTIPIALVVLLTSGRPLFYRGERVGRGGRVFAMLKFRTLSASAEDRLGPFLGEELVRRTAAETTAIGGWLRATQLDEIPQLWNVVRGDMSLVGPRPIRPRFFASLVDELPAYWQRLVVRPGLTGLAQVRRGYETSMAEKLAHDLGVDRRPLGTSVPAHAHDDGVARARPVRPRHLRALALDVEPRVLEIEVAVQPSLDVGADHPVTPEVDELRPLGVEQLAAQPLITQRLFLDGAVVVPVETRREPVAAEPVEAAQTLGRVVAHPVLALQLRQPCDRRVRSLDARLRLFLLVEMVGLDPEHTDDDRQRQPWKTSVPRMTQNVRNTIRSRCGNELAGVRRQRHRQRRGEDTAPRIPAQATITARLTGGAGLFASNEPRNRFGKYVNTGTNTSRVTMTVPVTITPTRRASTPRNR